MLLYSLSSLASSRSINAIEDGLLHIGTGERMKNV